MSRRQPDRDPAARIIAACGGINAVIDGLPIHFTRAQEWRRTGRIPFRQWKPLMSLAAARGEFLTVDDFMEEPSLATPEKETTA